MEKNIFEENIVKIVKKLDIATSEFNILPWIIFFIAIVIIIIYLIKIEIHSHGKNWEMNKCSSKYVFFSGFMNSEGENPYHKTMTNFQECIQRFL